MIPVPAPQPSRMIRAGGALVWRRVRKSVTPADIARGRVAPQVHVSELSSKASESASEPPVAGAIAVDELEVLLVHRPQYHDWSWPKGKLEPGENVVAAAVREVEEESGIPVVLHTPMLTQRYRLGVGTTTKEVYYWLGTVAHSGPALHTRPPVERAPKSEIDKVTWVPALRARKMLTRRGDRRLLDDLLVRAETGILQTATLILVATAQVQEPGSGGSVLGLDRAGVAHSVDLINLFSAFGVDTLIPDITYASRQTLRPYAAVSDLDLKLDLAGAQPAEVLAGLEFGHSVVVGGDEQRMRAFVQAVQTQTEFSSGIRPADLPYTVGEAQMLVLHLVPGTSTQQPLLVGFEYHTS